MNILAELEAIVEGLNRRIEALEQSRELNRRLVARVEALEAAEHHDTLVLPTIEETYGHDDVRELVLAARMAHDWFHSSHAHGVTARLHQALKHFENIK